MSSFRPVAFVQRFEHTKSYAKLDLIVVNRDWYLFEKLWSAVTFEVNFSNEKMKSSENVANYWQQIF